MIKLNIGNERIKRQYFRWLKQTKGFSDKTIEGIAAALGLWEEFTNAEDFSKFNEKTAIEYKEHLLNKKNSRTGKENSLTTTYHYLKYLYNFLGWLAPLPGYRSKFRTNDIAFLKLSKKDTRIALQTPLVKYPTLDMVKKVFSSIVEKNELDRRDKALIAFTLLSGMRDEAITTLSIGSVDLDRLMVFQDPKQGVKTKFSKYISTTLFSFDDELMDYFVSWLDYLLKVKLFSLQDPLFPANKIEQTSEDDYSFKSDRLEPKFWKSTSPMRAIFEKRFKDAGLEYFSPHKFRHLATHLANAKCKTPQEMKAVSQNLGHENVGTTMRSYGEIPGEDVSEIIKKINFSPKVNDDKKLTPEQINKLKQIIDENEA